jgi:hypothetical protein
MLIPFLQQNNRVATSVLWCEGDQSGCERGLAAHRLIREMGVLSIFSFLDSPGQFGQRRLVGVVNAIRSGGVSVADSDLQNPGARDGRCEDATVALSKWGYAVRRRREAGVSWLRRFVRQDEPDPSDNYPCPHLLSCSDLDHKQRGPGSNDMGAMGVVHTEMSREPSVDRRCYASGANRRQGASDRGLSAHTKRGLSRQG